MLSEKKAAEISSSVLDNARKLNAFLGSSECTPSDEFLAMVDGCKDLLDITATLASKEGGVPELGQALNDLKETMKQFGVDSMTKLGDWFAKHWLLVPETTGFDAVEKDNFRALTSSLKIRGQGKQPFRQLTDRPLQDLFHFFFDWLTDSVGCNCN